MVDDRPGSSVTTSNHTFNHRTLLSKYEIPIDHLSYEYINICSDVKELEKIIKILRSGEEGFYPHLESTAEERLRCLSPNNVLLRRAEPVLRISDVNIDDRNSVMRDVASWKEEISLKDLRLTQENNNCDEVSLPPIRQPATSRNSSAKNTSGNTRAMVPKVSDYAVWDKYDAETELLKIELEEEKEAFKRKKEKEEETKKSEERRVENERLNIIVQEAGKMSQIEREILAEEEKNRGNEYFQLHQYLEAIKYYSASIAVSPTVKAYNNRAAAYIQLKDYHQASEDATVVISMDPNNVKAHYRRAVTLKHQGKHKEAYEDVNFVIAQEPHNVMAQQMAEELRKLINDNAKTLRSTIQEGSSKRSKIIEILDVCGGTEPNLPTGATWTKNFQERNPKQSTEGMRNAAWFPSAGSSTSKAKIIELPDEPNDQEISKSCTKLEIVEVETSDRTHVLNNQGKKTESSRKSKKCVVIDKRTIATGESSMIREIS